MVKVFVILDGIGDRSCKVLDEKTPLEAAKTKNLDYFTSESNCGYVYAVSEQIIPQSEDAMIALLGNDPYKLIYSRGPLESVGSGLGFKSRYLAFSTNFSSIENDKIVDRRVGRSLSSREALEFSNLINQNVKLEVPFKFKNNIWYKGVLILEGDLSENVSNVDPAYKKIGRFGVAINDNTDKLSECRALDPDKKTKFTARIVNSFVKQSREILSKQELNFKRKKKYLLAANVIIPRSCGITLPNLVKHIDFGAIASMPLEKGILKLSGMKILDFKYPDMKDNNCYKNLFSGLNKTIEHSIQIIKEGNFNKYLIHIKETDIPGHDNKPKEKKDMIEIIDKTLFKFLRNKVVDLDLVVCGNYSNPCEVRSHVIDPIPLIHFGKGNNDDVKRFTEHECLNGHYGKLFGKNVLKTAGFL